MLNVHLLWRDENWKPVLQYYFGEEGTRAIRSLALYGLAAAKPVYYDDDGNPIGWITNSHHWATDEDIQRLNASFNATDAVMNRVAAQLNW